MGLNGAVVEVLRGERAARRLTLEEVAKAAEIPYRTLFRYFNAERAITMAILEPVALALGVTPAYVMEAAARRMAERSNVTPIKRRPPTEADFQSGRAAALREDKGDDV